MVGLGNPGSRYEDTRHNAGFRVVDAVAEELGLQFKKPWLKRFLLAQGRLAGTRIVLAKPLTFMNESGQVIPSLLSWANACATDLLVVYDNVDLSPGNCRLKLRGSAGGHNGLKSVARAVRGGDFMRLAVGIGKPYSGDEKVRHVLGRPSAEEARLIEQGVQNAAKAVTDLAEQGPEKVMNDLNRREPS